MLNAAAQGANVRKFQPHGDRGPNMEPFARNFRGFDELQREQGFVVEFPAAKISHHLSK